MKRRMKYIQKMMVIHSAQIFNLDGQRFFMSMKKNIFFHNQSPLTCSKTTNILQSIAGLFIKIVERKFNMPTLAQQNNFVQKG